jgi:hypothetical protein
VLIHPGRLIPLGYGRFVRSDDVIAIEPVTSGRGPQRRALVWVRGVSTPLTASRSEGAIAADLVAADKQRMQVGQLRSILQQMSATLEEADPRAA